VSAWEPVLDLRGNRNLLKVSASDASEKGACGLYLAVKVRPGVVAPGWRRYKDGTPFVLGVVRDVALLAHGQADTNATSPAWKAFLRAQVDGLHLHPGLRLYVETAVENYLDAHSLSETEVGPLRLVRNDPEFEFEDGQRRLTVWTPLYASEDGTAEVRRLRMRSPHTSPTDADMRWAAVAAYISARQGSGPARVRVVEVGLGDGNVSVLFDGTGPDADQFYAAVAGEPLRALVAAVTPTSGYSCGKCRLAGHCPEPVQLDGITGQPGKGNGTRSVSPSELKTYAECPAQWLLRHGANLPRTETPSPQQERGNAVHSWLEAAHLRGVPCTPADLPEPGQGLGLADGLMDDVLYERSRPFLLRHLDHCPLALTGYEPLGPERVVAGYDRTADVVPTMRVDLLYRLADRVVVRETKTTDNPLPASREDAYNKWPQVPWALTALRSGLAERHDAAGGLVEVEVLGPEDAVVYSWATDEPGVPEMAAGDVRRATRGWHTDTDWHARPGPYCQWCTVRQWCPDRDTHQAGPAPEPGSPEAAAAAAFTAASDEPPF